MRASKNEINLYTSRTILEKGHGVCVLKGENTMIFVPCVNELKFFLNNVPELMAHYYNPKQVSYLVKHPEILNKLISHHKGVFDKKIKDVKNHTGVMVYESFVGSSKLDGDRKKVYDRPCVEVDLGDLVSAVMGKDPSLEDERVLMDYQITNGFFVPSCSAKDDEYINKSELK
jgi:hypothetical protein